MSGLARLTGALVVLAAASAAILPGVAGAQTSGPVASGEFFGDISISGGFDGKVERGGITMVLRYDLEGNGPANITLEDGQMSGMFSMPGTAGFTAKDDKSGLNVVGTSKWSLTNGSFSGPPADYRMTSLWSIETTAVIETPGFGKVSNTSSESEQIAEPLIAPIVLCEYLVAQFDMRIRQEIDSIPAFNERIRGYVYTSTREPNEEEVAKSITQLRGDVTAWSASAASASDSRGAIQEGLNLLERSNSLMRQQTKPTPCPNEQRFVTELTLATRDVLTTLLEVFPGTTGFDTVILAVGTSAIGAGTPDRVAGFEVREAMKADIQARYEATSINDEAAMTDIALAADTIGIEALISADKTSSLSPTDLLLTITGEE